MGASDVTEDFRKVAERVASLGYKAWRVGIEKRFTVEIVVGARTMINCDIIYDLCEMLVGIRAVRIFLAPARLRRKGIVGPCIWTEQGYARNPAQPGVWSAELGIVCVTGEGDERRTTLVAMHTAHLPAAQHLVHNSALVQELLSLADGQLVKITEHKCMRDILVAQCLFRIQVARILGGKGVRAPESR